MSAILCCGQSWYLECRICEEKAYAEYVYQKYLITQKTEEDE